MFGLRSADEIQVFVSGMELSGVSSAELSKTSSNQIYSPLGVRRHFSLPSGPVNQNLSLNYPLIAADPLLNYTGDINMSGSIRYNDSNYGFASGYLETYALNCAVGAIPQVTANFLIADEMTSGYAATGSVGYPTIDLPTQGSISISCDDSISNRVVGFDLSISAKRNFIYSIGSKVPADVETIDLLQYSATVQIDVDEAFLENANNFLSGREGKTVSLSVDGRQGTSLCQISIPNCSLVSEQLSLSADGGAKLTINYIGHS